MKKIEYVRIERICPASFNPKDRVNMEVAKLRKSILQLGLCYPLLVAKDAAGHYTLIDGHRRYVVLRGLSVNERIEACEDNEGRVPVIVVEPWKAPRLFSDVTDTAVRLNGKQWVEVAEAGGTVPKRVQKKLEKLADAGITSEWLIEHRLSANILNTAQTAMRFADIEPLRDVVIWLGETNSSANLNAAVRSSAPVEVVRRAFRERRPINLLDQV